MAWNAGDEAYYYVLRYVLLVCSPTRLLSVVTGEKLSDEFDKCLIKDRDDVDLLLVLGTSLRVAPVSEIIGHLPHSVPQILINRDPVPHANFDICLLGELDSIVQHLCRELDKLEPGTWTLRS